MASTDFPKLMLRESRNVAAQNQVAVSTTCRTAFCLKNIKSIGSRPPNKMFLTVVIVNLVCSGDWKNFRTDSHCVAMSSMIFSVSSFTSQNIASLKNLNNFSVLGWKKSRWNVFSYSWVQRTFDSFGRSKKICPCFWTTSLSQLSLWYPEIIDSAHNYLVFFKHFLNYKKRDIIQLIVNVR